MQNWMIGSLQSWKSVESAGAHTLRMGWERTQKYSHIKNDKCWAHQVKVLEYYRDRFVGLLWCSSLSRLKVLLLLCGISRDYSYANFSPFCTVSGLRSRGLKKRAVESHPSIYFFFPSADAMRCVFLPEVWIDMSWVFNVLEKSSITNMSRYSSVLFLMSLGTNRPWWLQKIIFRTTTTMN